MPAAPRPARHPQARVLRNTALMMDATTLTLADSGWGALNVMEVARRMGSSERPVRNRARDRGQLGTIVWRDRLGRQLCDDLARACDALAEAREKRAAGPFVDTVLGLTERTPERDATAELLVQCSFNNALALAVQEVTAPAILELTTPAPGLSPGDAARNAYAIAMVIGLRARSRAPRARLDLRDAIALQARALMSDAQPVVVPDVRAAHLAESPVLVAEDPGLDALLRSCLELVGRDGYYDVTVRDIAERAGYTEGFVFHRYATKLELFIDATRRQNEAGWQLNREFTQQVEQDHGLGIAEAVVVRGFMLPSSALGRAISLEQLRLGWHHAEVGDRTIEEEDRFRASLLEQPGWQDYETEADFHLNVSVPVGCYHLPLLVPDAWTLPLDVVTVPVVDIMRERARA